MSSYGDAGPSYRSTDRAPSPYDPGAPAPASSLSVIPPRAPKKAGLPKLSLAAPRPAASKNGGAASNGGGLGGLTLSIPTSNGLSSLSSHAPEEEDEARMGLPPFLDTEDGLAPGSYSTAALQTIYPTTVPHAENSAALTNDLIRAIGGVSLDATQGSSSGAPSGTDGREVIGAAPHSSSGLAIPVSGSSRPAHHRTASATSVTSQTSSSGCVTAPGIDGSEPAEWVLKGNLVVTGRLGEGASGQVSKARHTPTGLVMAIKTISTSPNPAIHRQILRELSFNRTCHSEHIVRYYGAFLSDEDTSIVICMEQCEAGSLDGIYKMVKKRNGRTGEKVLGKVAEAGLKGLEYLRQRKIIHRDIKPSNILVTRSGQFKLCDFGVSGELINSIAGTFTGTSYYMAPERIKGLPYSINSDVWSLGLTILEVASNRFPFPPEGEAPLGPIDLLSYVLSMATPELQDDEVAGIKWSKALKDFIDRCLEKDSAKRPGPNKMLGHPFIKKSESRQPQPDIAKFVADVWGWPYPPAASASAAEGDTFTPTATNASGKTAAPSSATAVAAAFARLPSVRRAPGAPSNLSLKTAPNPPQSPRGTVPNTPTVTASTPVAIVDPEGRTAEERAAAKMREADVGLVGSPTSESAFP
ncbi:Pkinase-domain-containing protein [Ceraceosorus guamensis]|uniref:Pkinase-domain-containing protein n=1 Tax=Ceraceosorus guamensis TaxID=1522189 RepID=A0A316WCD8_9BASI|nr:Pkinase-domain-containing protein [Ceraceosorus guamensis]PWN45205.1 Pkinase-domain-containing protein [Ceraceosorus guamensis]